MIPKPDSEANTPSPRRKAGQAGGAGELGQLRLQVSAEAGTKSDDASSRQPEMSARSYGRLNADQFTLLVIALLLAAAIVVAAVILSKNL